ncbi:hypothetical protein Bca52824_032458 [Brassica carinata]|uniref:RNase H type-1 domain-containing protein n=1 Tax=Brassica carinata TaxID=52824 RepID=A0A8X7SD52_BRACI|nr:hypothetical protein Bca52824_032458 [Brassica carinata]
MNLEASVFSPKNPHISSSLMGSDDQRCRPSSVKAYWLQHGNVGVQSFDLTKVYALSLNPVQLTSLVWYDVFNEAIALRSTLCLELTLEFPKLKVFSDNSTLIRAISSNIQSKEIIGVVFDIRSISSEFASIGFSHLPRSKNSIVVTFSHKGSSYFLFYVMDY